MLSYQVETAIGAQVNMEHATKQTADDGKVDDGKVGLRVVGCWSRAEGVGVGLRVFE